MNKIVEKEALQGAEAVEPVTGLALLRRPFPDNQISQLPKPSKKQTDELKADFTKGRRCQVCGGWHQAEVVHLDYVGHAALTDRLLDSDIEWNWEPMAYTPEGLPAFDKTGGLWIRLTVRGVTRIGYGSADGKTGGDAIKEIIGDALRNSGMRFGAALDLWHKGDLHVEEDDGKAAGAEAAAIGTLRTYASDPEQFKQLWTTNKDGWKGVLAPESYARVVAVMQEIARAFPKAAPPAEQSPLTDDDIPEQFR